MDIQISYKLNVKKAKDLLRLLIDAFPINTLMSFEGDLTGTLIPRHLYSEKEQGLHRRKTRTPKQDIWVFRLDSETKDYLKKDFLNRIGLRTKVLHILTSHDNNIIFAAYDTFDDDCVVLTQTSVITDDFVRQLADNKIIREFEKIITVPNNGKNQTPAV